MESIIVYVTFQIQADQLAQALRSRNLDADSYHAGRAIHDRTSVQSRFLRGSLRIIVATVAFGLGINKSNIDSVIHYCMPRSIENYMQEIGRAGRDGRNSLCHLFLTREDYVKHRSFAYSDLPDEAALYRILQKLLPFNKKANGNVCKMSVAECEKQFDIKDSNFATIMSCIELKYPKLFRVMPCKCMLILAIDASIMVYPAKGISDVTPQLPVIESIMAIGRKFKGGLQIDAFDVAMDASISPREFVSSLWSLQAKKLLRFSSRERYQYAISLFDFKTQQEYDEFIENLCADLMQRLQSLENVRILKLDELYDALSKYSTDPEIEDAGVDYSVPKLRFKEGILAYFSRVQEMETLESSANQKWGFRDDVLIAKQRER